MKKQVVMLLLAAVCALSLIACGAEKQKEEENDNTVKTDQTDKEEQEEEGEQEQEEESGQEQEENENQVVQTEPRVIFEEGFDTATDFEACIQMIRPPGKLQILTEISN